MKSRSASRSAFPVCRYSLLEMLLVMSFGMLILLEAGRLFYDGMQFCRESTALTWTAQEVGLLRVQWRTFVHAGPATGWSLHDGALAAGTGREARVEASQLRLTADGRTRQLRLPRGVQATLALEQTAGKPDAAVLELRWESRSFGRPAPHAARIVACGLEQGGK